MVDLIYQFNFAKLNQKVVVHIVLFLYGTLFLVLIRSIRVNNKQFKKVAVIYLCGFVTTILNMMLEDTYFAQQFVLYFWIYAGLAILHSNLSFTSVGFIRRDL